MRCFIAIELPEEVRNRLVDLQGQMRSLGRAVRWTRFEQLHLTLKFLGEVSEVRVAEVCNVAQRIADRYPPFELEIRGTGCFPPRGGVRIVWADVANPPPALLACQKDCEDTYSTMNFERENRAYTPHLTIGRVNEMGASDRIREIVRQHESFLAGRFTAAEMTVFQSELSRGGSVYTPLAHARFGK